MPTPELAARKRADNETGTRACQKMRFKGEVPANLYKVTKGEQTSLENVNLAVTAYDLYQLIEKRQRIVDVKFDGRSELVRVSDIQRDQFGDDVQHIDLRVLDPSERLEVDVPIVTSGRPAIQDLAGMTIMNRRVGLITKPREIPEHIPLDLSKLSYGDVVTAGQLEVPAGSSIATPDLVIVTIAAKKGAKKADDAGEEAAE